METIQFCAADGEIVLSPSVLRTNQKARRERKVKGIVQSKACPSKDLKKIIVENSSFQASDKWILRKREGSIPS